MANQLPTHIHTRIPKADEGKKFKMREHWVIEIKHQMSQAGTIAGQFAVFVKRGRDATHKSTKVLPHAPEYHPQEVFFFSFFENIAAWQVAKEQGIPICVEVLGKNKVEADAAEDNCPSKWNQAQAAQGCKAKRTRVVGRGASKYECVSPHLHTHSQIQFTCVREPEAVGRG